MLKVSNIIVAVWLMAGPLALGGCDKDAKATLPKTEKKSGSPAGDPGGAGQAPVVAAATSILSLVYTGSVEPLRRSVISPRLSGNVHKVHVKEGDFVKVGQALVSLETANIVLQKRQAQAALDAAQANYDLSKLDADRMKPLYENGSIPKSQFDMVETRLKAGQAGLDQAQVALDMAKKALADSVARAPYAGVITKKMISEGEWVSTMPPTPMVVIEEIDRLNLRVQIPETEMERVALGDAVAVRFTSIDREVLSSVTQVVPSLDPRTRAFSIIIEIANPDRSLRPGMFAEVRLGPAGTGTGGVEVAP